MTTVDELREQFITTAYETFCPEITKKIVNKEALFKLLRKQLDTIDKAASDHLKKFRSHLLPLDSDVSYELRDFLLMIYLEKFVRSPFLNEHRDDTHGFVNTVEELTIVYKNYYIKKLEITDPHMAALLQKKFKLNNSDQISCLYS